MQWIEQLLQEPVTAVQEQEVVQLIDNLVRRVPVAEAVARYAVNIARMSRPGPSSPDIIKKYVSYGASVRAPQHLILGGKARALMQGRTHVNFEDIRALLLPSLRHRLILNLEADAEGITAEKILAEVATQVAEVE